MNEVEVLIPVVRDDLLDALIDAAIKQKIGVSSTARSEKSKRLSEAQWYRLLEKCCCGIKPLLDELEAMGITDREFPSSVVNHVPISVSSEFVKTAEAVQIYAVGGNKGRIPPFFPYTRSQLFSVCDLYEAPILLFTTFRALENLQFVAQGINNAVIYRVKNKDGFASARQESGDDSQFIAPMLISPN
jgi:hypothetical protein